MARMFPQKLPREVLDDPRRSSEVLVYNSLSEQLDDHYHIFYSSPWLGTLPDGSEIDGEADFLVAHAELGMLSLEVKGGRVEIDSDDNWTSTDRHSFTRRIKNPVHQARTSKHQLLKKLKESPFWKPRFICARHGVILPHSARPERDFRPDMPLKLFAFDKDIKHLEAWIKARFSSAEDDGRVRPLGDDGLYALDDMLARQIKLRVRLSTSVHEDLKGIQLKTDDQIFILKEMEGNPRMAIAGAAGTGKTILAIEKALMLAEQDKRVLLLCFNRPLGGYLQQMVSDNPSVTATSFHRYCRNVAKAAGKDVDTLSPSFMAEALVSHFTDADMDEYDAVIIDEGQDFTDEWLTSLEVVVKAGDEGVLYIFYDDNQKVMASSAGYIRQLPLAKYRLTRNFRNTQHIFDAAQSYYEGDYVRAIGPEGTRPEMHTIKSDAELKVALAERVGYLIKTEGLNPHDIAILFPTEQAASCLVDGDGYRVGRNRACNSESRSADFVVVDTIRRFKGLESPVVLLILSSDVSDREQLLYTGITRAQAVLEIFAPKSVTRLLKSVYQ